MTLLAQVRRWHNYTIWTQKHFNIDGYSKLPVCSATSEKIIISWYYSRSFNIVSNSQNSCLWRFWDYAHFCGPIMASCGSNVISHMAFMAQRDWLRTTWQQNYEPMNRHEQRWLISDFILRFHLNHWKVVKTVTTSACSLRFHSIGMWE